MALERVPADIRKEGMCAHRLYTSCPSDSFRRWRRQDGESGQAQDSSGTHMPQSDPKMIKEIQNAVTIPVMAKVRIGHIVEAQVRSRSE